MNIFKSRQHHRGISTTCEMFYSIQLFNLGDDFAVIIINLLQLQLQNKTARVEEKLFHFARQKENFSNFFHDRLIKFRVVVGGFRIRKS